jgi:diguanylate cyclase (GGDEF)-like protein
MSKKKKRSSRGKFKNKHNDQTKDEKAKLFEKNIYDLQQMLEISKSFCSTIELAPLIESILYIAMAQMRVMGAGIFILEEYDGEYLQFTNSFCGISIDPSIEYKICRESELIRFLASSEKSYTIAELQNEIDCPELEVLSSLKPTLVVPLLIKNHINGILILGERIMVDSESDYYTEYDKSEIKTISSLAAVAVHNASLFEQSTTDMMTKLKMKFYFYNALEDRLDSAFSQEESISVIMFDIDFFKKINDTYGHACGDFVLQKIAAIIRENIRECDIASRYGGEEFTVMLLNSRKDEAFLVAERIRKCVEETVICYEDRKIQLTISGGISEFNVKTNPVRSAKRLVDQADRALYLSKRTGRNRISVWEESVESEIIEQAI